MRIEGKSSKTKSARQVFDELSFAAGFNLRRLIGLAGFSP
jgi:hypothetical protein